MKEVDIRTMNRDELVDIGDIYIDENLSVMERVCSFMEQVKNLYIYRVDEVVVKCEFTENGPSLYEIIYRNEFGSRKV